MGTRLILIVLLFLAGCTALTDDSPAGFLARQNTSAKEYVLGLFENHDLVIVCERDHKEFTQYELLGDIISDPRFIENAGTVFTEIGAVNMGERINEFLHGVQPDSVSARNIVTVLFRDIDKAPYWHCYNYPWFLNEIHNINRELPDDKKISLYPSDWAISWYEIQTADDYRRFKESTDYRDSLMAAQIIDRFERIKAAGGKRKALVIELQARFSERASFLGRAYAQHRRISGPAIWRRGGKRIPYGTWNSQRGGLYPHQGWLLGLSI
ncbi:MAG: hypothetical protein LBU80_03660 [Rikenellaceae bacterium]|jgi:hypothetical protein|nr:hypothetical protein [Rikenellaceae bacterium]